MPDDVVKKFILNGVLGGSDVPADWSLDVNKSSGNRCGSNEFGDPMADGREYR